MRRAFKKALNEIAQIDTSLVVLTGDVEQEMAVVAFLNAKTTAEKEKIYRDSLREPINTMIDIIIRRYKLYRQSYEFKDIHADALSFLITKFDKFDPTKGKKSYSYFGTICKNYLINEIDKEYKKNMSLVAIDDSEPEYLQRDDLLYRIDVGTSRSFDNYLKTNALIKKLISIKYNAVISILKDYLEDNHIRNLWISIRDTEITKENSLIVRIKEQGNRTIGKHGRKTLRNALSTRQ
jgi:hypothetical protein